MHKILRDPDSFMVRLQDALNFAKRSLGETMLKTIRTGFLVVMVAFCFTAIFAGCKEKGARNCTISGEVTLDGTPIKEGAISFQPVEEGDLPSGAMILDGKYQTDVTSGKKIVKISASNPDPTLGPDDVAPDLIPAKYEETPLEIDVKKSGTHDFNLTSD